MLRHATAALTAATLAHAALAQLPEPSVLEQPFSADEYTFSYFNVYSSNPYAQNQFGGNQTPVSGADIRRLTTILSLTEEQQELARGMADELEDEAALIAVEHMESMADARAAPGAQQDWERTQREQRVAEERRRERTAELATTFYNDLRLLLTPEQEADWQLVDLDRQRNDHLRRGAILFVETMDPYALVLSLDIDDDARATAAPILNDYLLSLDPLLRERARVTESLGNRAAEHQERQQALWQDPEMSPEQRSEEQAKLAENASSLAADAANAHSTAIRVAQLNRRTINDLEQALPEDAVEKLHDAINSLVGSRNWGFADSQQSQQLAIDFDNTRPGRVFQFLQLDDTEEPDTPSRIPDEVTAGMNEEQLAIVKEMESLMDRLAKTGFNPEGGWGGPVTISDDDQRERLLDIRRDFEDDFASIKARFDRAAPRAQTENEPPLSISISTPVGTVSLQRQFDDPEEQQRAYARAQGRAPDESEIARIRESLAETEQDYIDRIRRELTIEQRRMIAGI